MKLYIKDQMVLPVLESLRLGKSRNDAAAILTASILTAPADTYFQKLSVALGDPARLLGDDGEELFLGSVHQISRTEDRVSLTAYDQGIYLTRNELHGLFAGTGAQIAAQAAEKLGIPLGKIEADGTYQTIVSRAGQSAFSILRRAVGEDREISIQNGALAVTAGGGDPVPLQAERVLSVSSRAGMGELVNRCVALGRNGRVLAQTQDAASIAAYGQFQRVRLGEAAALHGRTMSARATLLGDLRLRCGGRAEAGDTAPLRSWGLSGLYDITAVEHVWERGLFTTALSLEAQGAGMAGAVENR